LWNWNSIHTKLNGCVLWVFLTKWEPFSVTFCDISSIFAVLGKQRCLVEEGCNPKIRLCASYTQTIMTSSFSTAGWLSVPSRRSAGSWVVVDGAILIKAGLTVSRGGARLIIEQWYLITSGTNNRCSICTCLHNCVKIQVSQITSKKKINLSGPHWVIGWVICFFTLFILFCLRECIKRSTSEKHRWKIILVLRFVLISFDSKQREESIQHKRMETMEIDVFNKYKTRFPLIVKFSSNFLPFILLPPSSRLGQWHVRWRQGLCLPLSSETVSASSAVLFQHNTFTLYVHVL